MADNVIESTMSYIQKEISESGCLLDLLILSSLPENETARTVLQLIEDKMTNVSNVLDRVKKRKVASPKGSQVYLLDITPKQKP